MVIAGSAATKQSRGARNAVQVLAAAVLVCAVTTVFAQSYPARPVRLVVPAPPVGGADTPARAVGPKLGEVLGQPVVIDNRAGAGSTIGTSVVAKASPDGYTLLFVSASHAVNPSLYKKLPYDTVKDFASVSLVANGTYVLVTTIALPVKTVRDLIALAKAKPGELNFGSGGVGNINHLGAELFAHMAGIRLTHVPYKGGGAAMTDLLGGRLAMFFGASGTVAGQVRAGKVRALAVSTAKRSPTFPTLPTISEAGVPGYELSGWYAVFAPAKTPATIVNRVSGAIAKVVQMDDVRETLTGTIGLEPVGGTPAELDALVRADLAKWEKVVRALGIAPETY